MVGWFGRTVGCKTPRGEQMLMTCCCLVGFRAALSTPAPKIYINHFTPVKRSSWDGMKPFLHLPAAMAHSEPRLRTSLLAGPEQNSFGDVLCYTRAILLLLVLFSIAEASSQADVHRMC